MYNRYKTIVKQFLQRHGLTAACWAAIIANVLFVLFFFHQKNVYEIDEIYSFAHANSTHGAFLVPGVTAEVSYDIYEKYLFNRWHPGSLFHTWITVQPHEAFRYGHIVDNLKVGVHPPLFYILLHTICSFTPDVISKWQGAVLNIPLWLLLLWMLFGLAKLFFKDSFYAWCAVLLYAYSEVGLDTVLFIRGYLLQTLLAVCLVTQVTRLLQENKADIWRYVYIGVFATLGMLTHYNSLVFMALVGLVAGGILCYRKKWQLCWRLGLTLAVSGCLLIVLFPPAIDVLITSCRGKEAFARYTPSVLTLLSKMDLKLLVNDYLTRFWQLPWHCWFLFCEIAMVIIGYKYLKTKQDRLVDWLLCLAVAVKVYAIFTMPPMGAYEIRYTLLIYPLVSLVTVWYLRFVLGFFVRRPREKWTKWAVGVLVFINAWGIGSFTRISPFALHADFPLPTDQFTNQRVIVEGGPLVFCLAEFLAKAKEVYWIRPDTRVEDFADALNGADSFLKRRSQRWEGSLLHPLQQDKWLNPIFQSKLEWVSQFRAGPQQVTFDQYVIVKDDGENP